MTHIICKPFRQPFNHMSLCRHGAHLGNWNDHHFGKADVRADRPKVWFVIDTIASRMYTYGERNAHNMIMADLAQGMLDRES